MDELEKYYQYLKSKGANVPDSYNSFRTTLQDENSAKAYYDYLRKNKFNAPDTYDSFANTLGLKKKVGGAESSESGQPTQENSLPLTNASQPTTSVDFNKLNALQGGSQAATQDQKQMAEYGVHVQEATKEAQDKKIDEAADNSATLYFKNNPSLIRNYSLSSKKGGGDKFSLTQLRNASPYQQKVTELRTKIKDGELITAIDNDGKIITARPLGKWNNFKEGVSEAWNASSKADNYLKLSADEKIKFLQEHKPSEYLPEKADVESGSYMLGGAVPIVAKTVTGSAAGALAAATIPETGGLTTPIAETALPAIGAWMMTVPDMAKQGQMNAEIEAYHKIKQANPEMDDKEALKEAQKAGTVGYAEGLATGTAMNFIGTGLPKNTGQGLWKATGQFLRNQPQSIAEIGGLTAATSTITEETKKKLGVPITSAEEWDKIGKSMNNAAVMQLAFNVGHGLLAAPKFVKAQSYQVLSNVSPEELQALQQKAVEAGFISQEQANKTNESLAEFKEAQKKVIPTGNQEKDAVITGLVQKKNNLEKLKSETDKSYHDEIDAQIENADKRIQLAKQTNDPIRYAEQDDLDGTKNFNPKPFDELSKKEVEGIATEIPKEYGDAEVEEVGGGEGSERKYKANPTVNRQQGFIKIKDKISVEDKVYNDKEDAVKASEKALAEHYYNNGMDETLKPEKKSAVTVIRPEENKLFHETKEETKEPTVENIETGGSDFEPIPAEESGNREAAVGEVLQPTGTQQTISEQENIGGQDALRINGSEGQISHTTEGGENITEGSTGVRPSEQGGALTEAQSRATSSEEVPPITNEGKVGIHVQYPKTQLSHAGEDKLVTEFGGENYFTKPEVKSRQKLFKEADELMEKGVTAPKLMYDLSTGEKQFLSDAEHVVLVRYADGLANKLRNTDPSSAEWDRLVAERNKIINASSASGTEAARGLGARNIRIEGTDPNSYENFIDTEYVANDNAPLTPRQKETAIKEFTKLKEASEEEAKVLTEIEANVSKDKAEKAFNEEVKKTKSTKKAKKTHEDFVKERKDAVSGAREALKKIRTGESGLAAVPLPVIRELIAIAPHVKKALTSLAEEGYIKLADAVKQLHEDFKDVLDGLTEKNIHDIIANEYIEKQKPKSEIAKNIEDLRIEAQLVNRLAKALKGEWPKNEKQRQQRTKEIEAIRKQLEDLKKEEFEASKFYGESDAAQKRIWAKEDELQRLKERKPKVKDLKEKKEISEKEQQLNEEIKKERAAYNKELPDYEKKLQQIIKKDETETARLKEKLAKGEYSPDEKIVPLIEKEIVKKNYADLRKQAIKAKDERIKVSHEIALRRAKQMYQNRSPQEKTLEVFSKSLNLPRTLMTIGDFSAVMRQAAVATTAHPVIASKALKFMFEAAGSEKIYNRWLEDVHNDPLWETAQKSKLPITDPESLHTKEHEEAYYGSQYAEQVPGLGTVVKASERAYNGYLNFMRWEMFKMYAEQFKEQGKTFDNNEKLYKGLASFIGSATGRGGMRAGESAAPILNWFLFASRLIASRVNMLGLSDIPNLTVQGAKYAVKGVTLGKVNPNWGLDFGFYTRLPAPIRVAAMKDMLKFLATGTATLILAKQAGMEVELDPRSSDFGKIKIGNTRWDIWGGFQPYARLLTQIVTGQSKSATTGQVYELDATKYGGRGIGEQIGTFARGKLAPTWGIAADILTRRTLDQKTLERRFDIPFYSKDNPKEGNITLTDELIKSITPLIGNDVFAAMQDKGLSALLTVGLPSLFGIGVQTYAPRTPRQSSNSNSHSNSRGTSHKVSHGHDR